MNRRLKITLAAVALHLALALGASGQTRPAGTARLAADGAAAVGRRAPMSQRSGPRQRRAGEALVAGVWGGEHIRFEVTERGANVEYDCAHGTVEGKIVVDSRGRFNVTGTHFEEHGGPIRADESQAGYPVRLSGRVGGSLMKLTVTRAGTRKVIGVFTLARDQEAGLVKCR